MDTRTKRIELHCHSCYSERGDTNNHDEAVAYIQELDRRIIELGESIGIPVVVTGDVHFATREEAQVRAVLQDYIGDEHDNQLGLQLRDTDEMLEVFSYLGRKKAREIVVENTYRIVDKIENFVVFPKRTERYYPQPDDAHERLNNICLDKLYELYGEDIEQSVLDLLMWYYMRQSIGIPIAVISGIYNRNQWRQIS